MLNSFDSLGATHFAFHMKMKKHGALNFNIVRERVEEKKFMSVTFPMFSKEPTFSLKHFA